MDWATIVTSVVGSLASSSLVVYLVQFHFGRRKRAAELDRNAARRVLKMYQAVVASEVATPVSVHALPRFSNDAIRAFARSCLELRSPEIRARLRDVVGVLDTYPNFERVGLVNWATGVEVEELTGAVLRNSTGRVINARELPKRAAEMVTLVAEADDFSDLLKSQADDDEEAWREMLAQKRRAKSRAAKRSTPSTDETGSEQHSPPTATSEAPTNTPVDEEDEEDDDDPSPKGRSAKKRRSSS